MVSAIWALAQIGQILRQLLWKRLRKPIDVIAQVARLRIGFGLDLAVACMFGLMQQLTLQLDDGQPQRPAERSEAPGDRVLQAPAGAFVAHNR